MSSQSDQENINWYVLNFIRSSYRNLPQKTIDRFNVTNKTKLELFAPTYVVKEEKQGELKFRTLNLTFHYVFVRGSFDDIKQLCGLSNGFSFLIDHSNEDRYAVIDDKRMMHFQNIARAYRNCLPYFSLDDIELEDGDIVEVVKGDFPGLIGHYMPNAKSKTGNIVLSIFNNVGTIAFNVKVTDVRVLEFSKRSTRANDQIDAFVPHLLKALRAFYNNEALTTSLAAKLSVFCGRMGIVRLNNHKLDARLQILLYAANHIIGNSSAANIALEKLQATKDSVTNEWSNGTIELIFAILNKDRERLASNYSKLNSLDATSKAQQMILAEYTYYLADKQ